MSFSFQSYNLQSPFDNLIDGLEAWCLAFNEFAVVFFGYMKYILAFILIAIGILTLLKFRGIYSQSRLKVNNKKVEEYDSLFKTRLILGTFYIVLASAILLNWFIYFLIFILEPFAGQADF